MVGHENLTGYRENVTGVMRNLKGVHKTLKSQFLYHIYPVHFKRINFLIESKTNLISL
jgi:hypothetical protein